MAKLMNQFSRTACSLMMKAMKLAFVRGFAFRTRQLVANGALAVSF